MIDRRVVEAHEAVCADPEDEGLREALAAAWEAADEPERARFMRLQVERASLPRWDARTIGLELEERALLARHEARWRAELPTLPGVTWGGFERGLVSSAGFQSAKDLVDRGPEAVAAAPLTRALSGWPRSKRFPKLPALGRVRQLTLVGAIYSAKDLGELGKCPLLDSVREIDLVDANTRTGLAGLLRSERLEKLEALRIPHHQMGNGGMKALVSASLPALVELRLDCERHHEDVGSGERFLAAFTEKAVYALSLWPGLQRLESLDVSGNLVGIDAMRVLLGSPSTPRLRRLRIRRVADDQWDQDDTLEALALGPRGALDELDLGDNDLNPSAAQALAEGPAVQSLKVLRMDHLRSRSFELLSSARWRHEVRVLHLDAAALPSILRTGPRKLHTLVVEALPEDDVIAALETRPLPDLQVLDLSRTSLDDAALARLGELDLFPSLIELRARQTRPAFTRAGAEALASSQLGRQLKSLTTGFAAADRLPQPIPTTVGYGSYRGPLREL
ncbi:MAG: hypothetical protein KC619_05820 [Myxococcales bacterium]|nr:hypothetical protein [Myxococcales bacterium]